MKKRISILLATLMLLLIAAPSFVAVGATDYFFSYTYSDIQAEKYSDLQRYKDKNGNYHSNIITDSHPDWGSQDLPYNDASHGVSRANLIYLAKNEREGFQVYFYEKGAGRNLRLEVGEFTNAAGDVLPHEVFREAYFTPEGLSFEGQSLTLADALIPCDSVTEIETVQGENEMFYIEVRSSADQPAGVYYADVKLYDGDTALTPTKGITRMAAVVWDFALPEQHYGSMITGLYNTASNYAACTGFLTQNGVNMYGWTGTDVAGDAKTPEDREKMDAILAGWQEYLLDHGITTYEIPRHLIDDDPKAAELALADVRRKNFFVPMIHSPSGGQYDEITLAKILQYKDLIGDNEYLMKKATLYVADEPDLASTSAAVQNKLAAAKNTWPELRRLVTYCNTNYTPQQVLETLNADETVICLNNSLLAGDAAYFNAYTNDFTHRWRYHGDMLLGGVELWKWGKSTNGMLRRILFWQQHAMEEDTFLYWNCAAFGDVDIWGTRTLPASSGVQTGNGNGILLYPGVPVGQPAETPIASLRLKQAASGIDDADYLALAKEFMSEEDYITYLRSFLKNAKTEDKAQLIFNTDGSYWAAFPMNETYSMNAARIRLGNALESVVGEHEFGDWEIVVTPDETHNGLAVRRCANCGTEESKKIGLCDEGHHYFGDPVADNEETHTATCEVCGVTETAAHTPETVPAKAPTCTSDGATESVVCADCGYVITAAETVPGGHKLGEWIEGEEATCVKEGVKGHYTCSVCKKDFDADGNELASIAIPKDMKHHVGKLAVENAVPATCTTAGYTGDSICTACGNVKTPGEAIPAKGHKWNAGEETKAPGCTEKGVKTYTCADCGATRTEEIAALGHAAADENGNCTRCGASIVSVCPYCGGQHTGFFGSIVAFFHRIAYFFRNLFAK